MAGLGEIRREFESRLSDDWHGLAVQLEIPAPTKNKWKQGFEAAEIWEWLNARKKLTELAPALVEINPAANAGGDQKQCKRRIKLFHFAIWAFTFRFCF